MPTIEQQSGDNAAKIFATMKVRNYEGNIVDPKTILSESKLDSVLKLADSVAAYADAARCGDWSGDDVRGDASRNDASPSEELRKQMEEGSWRGDAEPKYAVSPGPNGNFGVINTKTKQIAATFRKVEHGDRAKAMAEKAAAEMNRE